MTESDPGRRRREATVLFKLGLKASSVGVHCTLNRPPKGKGWVESIAHYERAYQTFPDIVVLNQIALGYEMLGEFEAARTNFARMREQALAEGLAPYVQAADLGLGRLPR